MGADVVRMVPLMLVVLAACAPQDVARNVSMRAAESVIRPVLDDGMTGAEATLATRCVLDNATPAEIDRLARDVGTYAGTATEAEVRAIAARPATMACLAAAKQPQIGG